ncbi:MAG: medium chain dehydrogenase/reductase family protein [Myxococcota bacterium]
MQTVHSVVVHQRGGYEQLRIESRPTPALGSGSVRIDVEAIGVNYADCIVRMGLYKSAKDFVGWPITPGFEVAGTVAEVADDVDDLEVGEPVMAVTRFGGYTTQLCVRRSQVFSRPAGFDAAASAAFCGVHLTADYAISELAGVRPGDAILVHSAAGGVGTVLVQLGRHLGCRVAGVVGRGHKVDVVRELGADAVIDKSSADLWTEAERFAPEGFKAVFDANGVATLRESYEHLMPTGRVVVYGFATMLPKAGERMNYLKLAWDWLRTPRFNPMALTSENRSVMGFNLSYMFDQAEVLERSMSRLLARVDAGALRPPPIATYPLSEVGRAHRDLESGQTVGKLVLVPDALYAGAS